MHTTQIQFVLLATLMATTITSAAQYPSDNVVQNLQKRDEKISELVGRTISGIVVAKVTHLARLDTLTLTKDKLGLSLTFDHAELIDKSKNVVDFQFQHPIDGDSAHLKFEPSPAINGKVLVAVFNVYGVKEFTHLHARTFGDATVRPFGRNSGTSGLCHIPMQGINPVGESVTYSLFPETDDPWLFGSRDIYVLE